jgi:hypothetical protein
MTADLETLLIQETTEQIYEYGLALAASLGLPVSTWQEGDPTRSLYHLESELLSKLEEVVVNYIKAGFTQHATGAWLKLRAEQVYKLTVPAATFATCSVTLTNNGGGFFTIEPNSLTFSNSLTGKTYHNTSGGTLASGPGTTLAVDVEADEAGSDSSAGIGEIDELVTGLTDVTCANTTTAVGADEQSAQTTRLLCDAKLDALSPNGADGAYVHVALTPGLSDTTAVTRARVYDDSDTGDVLMYLAGPSGAVAEADRALVETAVLAKSTPLCITPTVLSAGNIAVAIAYQAWIYRSANLTEAEAAALIEDALANMLAAQPIGGDIPTGSSSGSLFHSLIEATILAAIPGKIFRVVVTTPSGDTALTAGQVAVLGAVTPSITLTVDP